MKNTIKNLVLLTIFASQVFAENVYHSQNEEFLSGITIDKKINFTGTTDDVIIDNQSLQEHLDNSGSIKIKGITSPEAQSETTFEHVSGIRFDKEYGFTISSNNDGFINVEMNSAWTELIPDFPNQEYDNLKPQGEEKLAIKVVESDKLGTYWDYSNTNKNEKTFNIGIPKYATETWTIGFVASNHTDIEVERDIPVFTQDTPIINLNNGNKQFFDKTDYNIDTVYLELPSSDNEFLSTLVIYAKEIPSFGAFFDFDDTNINSYPDEKPWLAYNEEDAIWKFTFQHLPNNGGWQFLSAIKYKITFSNYIVNTEDGIIYTAYPKVSGSVTIPKTFYGSTISSIGANAFENSTELTEVIFQDNIESINEYAFAGSTSLSSITIGTNVTFIGEHAFDDCNLYEVKYYHRTGEDSEDAENRIKEMLTLAGVDVSGLIFEDLTEEEINYEWVFDVNPSTRDENSQETITIKSSVPALKKTVIIPREISNYLVTEIADEAFKNNTEIESITFPNSIKVIGQNAFNGCTGLKTINLPNGDCELKWGAFYGCTSLKNVRFPTNRFNIVFGDQLFNGCKSLKSIKIPEGCKQIPARTFYSCTGLTNVILADTVTNVYWEAFRGCSNLRSITIGTDLNSVYSGNTYSGCPISNVVLRSMFTKISGIFPGASYSGNLKSVTLDDAILDLPGDAFNGCSALKNVTMPRRLKNIGDYAFYNCNALENINIPTTVTNIGQRAFFGCTKLQELNIPYHSCSIGDSAFDGCKSLKQINLPRNYNLKKSFGSALFANSTNIESVKIYNNNGIIPNSMFDGCYNLTNVYISTGIKDIGSKAFLNCNNLQSITIPDTVTNIGNQAFEQCKSLTNITLPENVKTISERLFSGCSNLEEIHFADDITGIGILAFKDTKIKDIEIPNGVTSIGTPLSAHWGVFHNCNLLTNVILPTNLTFLGSGTFQECSNLPTVNLPEAIPAIYDFTFKDCRKLQDITIPNNVTSIGESAFERCYQLTNVVLSTNLQTIGKYAFLNCTSLSNLFIPSSVSNITEYAFAHADNLKNITMEGKSTNQVIDMVYGLWRLPFYTTFHCTDGDFMIPYTPTLFHFNNGTTVAKDVIGDFAASDIPPNSKTQVGKIEIGNSVFTLDANELFKSFTALTNVVFSENLNTIRYRTFMDCSKLKEITIPSNIVSIGSGAFQNCTSLETVSLYGPFERFSGNAFQNCTNLSRVNTDSLSNWCMAIYDFTNANPATVAGGHLYLNGDLVTNVVIPEGIENLKNTFYNNDDITSVVLPTTLKSITDAFGGCHNITNISIPNYLASEGHQNMIKSYFPDSCTNELHITFDNSVSNINGSSFFYGCSNIASITIGTNVQAISDWALDGYYDNVTVTNLVIPNSVTYIGMTSFRNYHNLQSMTLPDSVTFSYILYCAFDGCNNLNHIKCVKVETEDPVETIKEKLRRFGSSFPVPLENITFEAVIP